MSSKLISVINVIEMRYYICHLEQSVAISMANNDSVRLLRLWLVTTGE